MLFSASPFWNRRFQNPPEHPIIRSDRYAIDAAPAAADDKTLSGSGEPESLEALVNPITNRSEMEGNLNRLWIIPAAVTLALVSGPGFAQSAGNDGNRAAPNRDRLSSWTPAAMERAKQVQLPTVSPDAVAKARTGDRAARPANPGSSPAKDLVSDRERSSGNVYEKPLYWAGKLFFRSGNDNYVCSAQFISPTVLLTAAHCVRDADTGEWHDDL
ncbi:MAG: trypsin-like serine protease, partial [Bauldia sp.]|nr:trypsin-like serine protease [Bauldia sp.]